MLLKIEKLSKAYNKRKDAKVEIFNNLDLCIKDDKVTVIFGPSGVGKSTLLNMLGTVDAPDSGKITLNGVVYDKGNYQKLRKNFIGYMFQFHYLLPEFTIFENLKISLDIKRNKDLDRKDIEKGILQILRDFDIESKINCYPSELSGGEKQRASLARAIINNPSIVLADEPTGNLDAKNSENIINKIQEISIEKDIKFIIATHNQRFENIASSMYEIRDLTLIKK